MVKYDLRDLCTKFESVCRFCLSEEDCVPVFIKSVVNNYLIDAIDVLLLKVDENDGLPNRVCKRCHENMANFSKFEVTAEESYRVLEMVLAQNMKIDGDGQYESIQVVDNISDEPQPSDESGVVEFLEETTVDTLRDVSDELSSDPSPSKTMDGLEEHLPKEAEGESDTKDKKSHPKKACPVCGKLVSQVSKHMQIHRDEKKFPCAYCDKRFSHLTSRNKHLKIHRNIRQYECEYCSQRFCDRSSLRYHEAKHQGLQPFQCEICQQSFYTSSMLKQHQASKHQERTFRCEVCGKMFHLKHHLADHVQIHNDARPFECDVCGKSYKRARYLVKHRLYHNDKAGTSRKDHSKGFTSPNRTNK